MPTYRMVYGDDEQVVRQTFHDVRIEAEDGWTVLFRGRNAILRVRDEHVAVLELLTGTPRSDADAPRGAESGAAGGQDPEAGSRRATSTGNRRP